MPNFTSNKKVQLLEPIYKDINVDLISVLTTVEQNWDEPLTPYQVDYILNVLSILITPSISKDTKSKVLDSILMSESMQDLALIYNELSLNDRNESAKVQLKVDNILFDAIRKDLPRVYLNLQNPQVQSEQLSDAMFSTTEGVSSLTQTQKFLIASTVLLGTSYLIVRVAR